MLGGNVNDGTTTVARRSPSTEGQQSTWMDLLDVAAIPRRMAVLSTLGRAGEISITELTARVVARSREVPVADVTEEQFDETMAALEHQHLPALFDRGLLSIGADELGSVALGPAFDSNDVDRVEALVESGSIDETLADALADPTRRQVVSILAETDGVVGLDELVGAVAAREPGWTPADLRLRLYHCDLPKLAAAGVVDFRPDEELVGYDGLWTELEVAVKSK